MGGRQRESPEGDAGLARFPGDDLQVLPPGLADAFDGDGVVVEGQLRQRYLPDECLDVFLVRAAEGGGIHIVGEEVQVLRVLLVHGRDPCGECSEAREVGDDRFIPQEIAVQGRMVFHGRHDFFRPLVHFRAGIHDLDAGLLAHLEGLPAVLHGFDVGETDRETAVFQHLVVLLRKVRHRDAVPGEDGHLRLRKGMRLASGEQGRQYGQEGYYSIHYKIF